MEAEAEPCISEGFHSVIYSLHIYIAPFQVGLHRSAPNLEKKLSGRSLEYSFRNSFSNLKQHSLATQVRYQRIRGGRLGVNLEGWGVTTPRFSVGGRRAGRGGRETLLYLIIYRNLGSMFESGDFSSEIE